MVKGYYLAVVQELTAPGFAYSTNAKGSHEKWIRGSERLIVPQHLFSRHTANAILKEAGSSKRL